MGTSKLTELPPRDVLTILAEYGPLTTRELAEIHIQLIATIYAEMEKRQTASQLKRYSMHGGEFWTLAGESTISWHAT